MKLFDTHCVALYQELSIKSDQNLGKVSKGHLLSVMLFIASLSSNTYATSGFHHSSCYWLSPLQLLLAFITPAVIGFHHSSCCMSWM